MFSGTLAEIVWLVGIILFATMILFSKNKSRGLPIKLGSAILVLSYLGMLQESSLSFTEISWLSWGVRIGITLVLYELALKTQLGNPKAMIDKMTHKEVKND